MKNAAVGAINLECLMNRANILFTNGYRFKGTVHLDNLRQSFAIIADAIDKFKHALHFEAQNNFSWIPTKNGRPFEVIEAEDLDLAFAEFCRGSLSLVENGQCCPMALTVILDKAGGNDFILAQTSEHTYVDARSAETLFHLIVDHYNALCAGDHARLPSIVAAARDIACPKAADMIAHLGGAAHDENANLEGLAAYPIADVGGYAIALEDVPACLDVYRQQRFEPLIRFFDVKSLVERCRAKYPDVTRNAVVCAALAKGFYDVNVAMRGAAGEHPISFKMLSDLLPPDLRKRNIGNFIAFVPVTVEGSLTIEDMAKSIHDRIRHFKTTKLDLSVFSAVEQAVDAGVVGTADDPLSFVVTNWSNHRLLSTSQYLHGCETVRHQSGVNIEPRDTLGAVLVNRPILVINMSPNDELCLSFFPSLRSQEENATLAARIGEVIDRAG